MGALTNKPMAFNSRNWEYNSQITYDLTDLLTPKIRVDQFSGRIYRILPTVDWISNKIRFLYLGLRNQRVFSPLFVYNFSLKIKLVDQLLVYEKRVVITNRLEKAFKSLKARILSNKIKNINLILGAIFHAKLDFFKLFENNNTRVNFALEYHSKKSNISVLPQNFSGDLIFFGVNPRMESPLLNLKIRESNLNNIYSCGNLNFSYNVSVIDNSSYLFTQLVSGKSLVSSQVFFGLSSLKLAENFVREKFILLPNYLLNNITNYMNISEKVNKSPDDLELYLAPQNLFEVSDGKNLKCIVSSHFEKISNDGNSLRLPIAGYLESNFEFLDQDFELRKINSVKPSYGIDDFLSSFQLYNDKLVSINRLSGKRISYISNKVKVYNTLLANNVPNYLVRDPMSRANPLFVNI